MKRLSNDKHVKSILPKSFIYSHKFVTQFIQGIDYKQKQYTFKVKRNNVLF